MHKGKRCREEGNNKEAYRNRVESDFGRLIGGQLAFLHHGDCLLSAWCRL